ncbi:zinc ABC transporter substrate-binding protein AztC [Zhihengliuella alba]|uniref:Zinc ABC transporter substrate-binding protein AztC n=1 Tax=Zhihengliuella alba TaxID=547018 RepID=A0ABP7DZQ3_9MICC
MSARSGAALAGFALVAALTGCSALGGASADDEEPQIVVTTNILDDVVENVVGDQADVLTLMKPNADPHSFEVSAQEAARMGEADLVVSNGLGLEEGLQQHLDRAEQAGAEHFVAGDEIEPLAYSGADAGGAADPHFWTDPARMVEVVDALEERLGQNPRFDAAALNSAAEAYRAELTALDEEMTAAFAALPAERRALVTNHHVFGYLAERYDFRVIGAIIPGGSTLASPSAADLEDLASAIREAGVPTVFAESSQPDRLAQVLATEAGVEVDVVELFTESLTEPGEGAEDYLTMMRANTELMTEGLSR